ncbi:hypothetical protein GTO84_07480 [Ligilactobacillus salivarius]|nr:hypothetical protein [Ligilactobacillus salivarius]QLL72403.1 hypothetical protein GTO84_07480 [Ligilactobacillus salivarius]
MYKENSIDIEFLDLRIKSITKSITISYCKMQIISTYNEIKGILTIGDDVANYNDLHLSENGTVKLCGCGCINRRIPKDVDKYIKIKNMTNLGGKEYGDIEIKCSIDGIEKVKDALEINVVLLVL